MQVKKIYERRFSKDVIFRNDMWRILCHDFFQKWVPEDSTILEIAAGYCEFINNITAKNKLALDINPDTKNYANQDVQVILSNSEKMESIPDSTIDIVFISNFFEHITKTSIEATILDINRVLVPNGKLIILQPNIRFCYQDYWMFFDHITPIDDRALGEILEINQFEIIRSYSKFLPYTTKSALPKSLILIKLYLRFPLIWKLFGKQALIYCQKK